MKMHYHLIAFILCTGMLHAQTGQVTPNENLVAEGIPPIPKEIVDSVDRYTKGHAAEILDWHPKKKEMLIVTELTGNPQIHYLKFPGAARTQLTWYPDNPSRGVSFQPTSGKYFIFTKDVGGDENSQIYRYDFADGAITLLTDGHSKNSAGAWSHAGDRIVYGSTKRNGQDVDLYIMDPSKPGTNRMFAQLEGGGWIALDWSPDDKTILAENEKSANSSDMWLIDVASGAKTLLSPQVGTENVWYGIGQFSKDGKGLYVVTDRNSEFNRLVYVDVQSHKFTPLTEHINWDIQEFKVSPNGELIGLVANEDGLLTLHLIDAHTGKDVRLVHLPAGYVVDLRWHNNGRYLGFSLDSVGSPSDAYSLDTKTLAVERWTYSENGGLNTDKFIEPKLIHWRSFDGLSISGFLYRPPTTFTGRRPVIIDIHGGPEGQFQPFYQGRDSYFTNELGIAVIHPNVRGSTGYGKTFMTLDNGFRREGAYKDIGALLDWIKAQPDLDPDRVMVTGVSYGGHMTLATSYLYNDRIRCAIDDVGPANLVTFLEHTAPYRQDLRRVEYGDERDPKMKAFLEKIAPLNNAEKIKKPLFIIQGANDPRNPLEESDAMVAALRKNGTPVWYLMAKDEGHGLRKRDNSEFQFYATVLFIKKYLLN